MTGGTSMFLSVVLLVNKFHFRLVGKKRTTNVVKPSYVQEKSLCHENSCLVKRNYFVIKLFLALYLYMCVHMCIMNFHIPCFMVVVYL